MKYEKEILASFKNLGFTPRTGQAEGINLVLTEMIDNKKKDIILCAPTGSGKSIIGAVVPEALSMILGGDQQLKSVIAMHNNTLVEQYANTFKDHKSVIQIKGASNYPCGVMDGTADNCVASSIHIMPFAQGLRDKHCNTCEFAKLKSRRNSVNHLITNFSFIFVDRMLAGILEPRLCYVWDEAHMLNDLFTDHNAIYVSPKRLRQFIEDISKFSVAQELTPKIQKLLIALEAGKVDESNYEEFITYLGKQYSKTKEFFEIEMEKSLHSKDVGRFKICGNMLKMYGNFNCKIGDLLTYKYKHVFDYIPETKEFTIKAIFIDNMFDVIRNSKYNLFMSATLSQEYLNITMKLDPKTTAFIKLPSQFPKENKTVLFVQPLMKLNYSTMQQQSTLNAINKTIGTIVKFHAAKGESGIILVPSFKVGEMIAKFLKAATLGIQIFEHIRGENASVSVNKFKVSKKTGVLISPSIFEGIDLPGSCSRFQIITKVPYPSLGDKRIKTIMEDFPKVYEAITLHKLIQGLGRSIRNEDDYATSYILDAQGERLLNSDKNVWFDEFDMMSIELK